MDYADSNKLFEGIKRKAAALSNEIDLKLVSFSRLSVGSHRERAEEQPLLADEDQFDNMKTELERLLKELTDIVDQMNDITVRIGDVVMKRTLTRNMEILQSYTREFEKTESNFRSRMERHQLFSFQDGESGDPKAANGRNRRQELSLKEHEHVRSSHRLVDEQIAIALETREHLGGQRMMFKRIQTRMNDLANRFPMVNSLIQRINSREKRNAVAVGLVVALCTFLLLIYAFW